ncbi:MAG: formylmethanofuran dehydrogenase subunit C [Gemmatimonadales bacterium]|nr:formylmethanofuran dehydrogenase subunit C [Gemmatimonadales bacterium]
MSEGVVARLRQRLRHQADLGEVLAGGWTGLGPSELAVRPVYLEGSGTVPLGELFDLRGEPAGRIRFEGDLARADRLAAGLAEGEVIVEGSVGAQAGLGMAGGTLRIQGSAGPLAGAAGPAARRGMTGGELIIRGSAGAETGARMRRGLLAIGGQAEAYAGHAMIAGTILIFGDAGPDVGLWSKRGSVVALGAIEIPATYRYACTYRPAHLGLTLTRLRARYGLPVKKRHFAGRYHRYSGDLADLGKGEILEWTAE